MDFGREDSALVAFREKIPPSAQSHPGGLSDSVWEGDIPTDQSLLLVFVQEEIQGFAFRSQPKLPLSIDSSLLYFGAIGNVTIWRKQV